MIRLLSVAFVLFTTLSATSAEELKKANALAEIFEPGTNLAIRSAKGAEHVDLTIITSAEFFEIAKDSTELELSDLSEKYPEVDHAVQDKKKELATYIEDNRSDLKPGWDFGEPRISLRRPGGELGTVVHVGADFIVVSFDETSQRRRLFSTRFIRTVDWHEGDLEIFGTVPRHNKRFHDGQKTEK